MLGPVRLLTGRFLAHNKWTKPRRAFLGVDILSGRVQPVRYTDKQVADLVGVSVPYLTAAKRVAHSRPDLRSACECGLQPLLDAVPRSGRAERMARLFTKMSVEEQRTFARTVGPDALFGVAVEAA
jgi:hypothetical protein